MRASHVELPPLNHRWQMCFGQGRAAELLREDFMEHLAHAKRLLGFRYLRFHGLFHDEMTVVSRRADGTLCFQWKMIDRIFDRMLELGIRPFVELNPMPSELASGDQVMFHFKMNVTPPAEFSEWAELVEEFARHCVQRYGLKEVREWYFEVWNEPNLAGFWSGTQEAYFELYRHSAQAVKRVHPDLRIGGPATAQGRWVTELIDWCVQQEVPIDFVSTHSYQQDELNLYPHRKGSPHAPSDYLLDQFKRIKAEVESSPLPELEIHWTEWNALSADKNGKVSWIDNPSIDSLYSGSFLLHHCVRADSFCDSMSWWIISDLFGEAGISPLPYSHTYGLLTSYGIPKPSLHAFSWLSRMNGDRFEIDGLPDNPACGHLLTREAGCSRLLLWYHPPVEDATGQWQGSLELDLEHDSIQTQFHMRERHGSAYELWQSIGAQPNLSKSQEEALRRCAEPATEIRPVHSGRHILEFSLQPYEVLFVEWTRSEAPALHRGIAREFSEKKLEDELAAKSRD